jgi:membrane associated rhomboid family serine protease
MFLPLHDTNPIRHIPFPYVTYGLLGLNVAVFLAQLAMPNYGFEWFTVEYGMIPVVVRNVIEQPVVWLPDWANLVTYAFLHADWLHLLSNMLFLWIFGDNVEDNLGHGRYAVFYLLTGILASVAHVVSTFVFGDNPFIPSLGASGAISAVMGGYLVLHPKRRVRVIMMRMLTTVPAYVAVGLWFVFQLISAFGVIGQGPQSGGGVAFMAHIGGFIAGAALVKLFAAGVRPARA